MDKTKASEYPTFISHSRSFSVLGETHRVVRQRNEIHRSHLLQPRSVSWRAGAKRGRCKKSLSFVTLTFELISMLRVYKSVRSAYNRTWSKRLYHIYVYIQNNRKPLNLGKEHAIEFIYRGCRNFPSFIHYPSSLCFSLVYFARENERRYIWSRLQSNFDPISDSEPMQN